MLISFGENCKTEASRLSKLYRMRQKMIELFNVWGKKYRDGEITEVEWEQWKNTVYYIKQRRVVQPTIHAYQMMAMFVPYWVISDINDCFQIVDDVLQIKYPALLDPDNDGSKHSFLNTLAGRLNFYRYAKESPERIAYEDAHAQIITLSSNSNYWPIDLDGDFT